MEHNSRTRRRIFPKSVSSVSADPEEQVGAKNSISPKNDLGSFCTNVTNYNLFQHKCSHLSILGTLFFFCFVLSYNRAVPNYFHNRAVPNHFHNRAVPNHFHNRAVPNHFHTPNYFHIKFLICSCTPHKICDCNQPRKPNVRNGRG